MEFQLDDAIEILSRTPEILNRLLGNLPERWALANEGRDTWSAFDVLGHLIHGEETDWMPRAKIILEHGESRAFEPFDGFAQFEKAWEIDNRVVGRIRDPSQKEPGRVEEYEDQRG